MNMKTINNNGTHGRSYITRKLNWISDEYNVSIVDVVNLYNCMSDDPLGVHLILENFRDNKSGVNVSDLYNDVKGVWLLNEKFK